MPEGFRQLASSSQPDEVKVELDPRNWERITDAMVEVEGENMRPVTLVVIEEVRSGDWAIGGRAFTTSDVHALAAAGNAQGFAAHRPHLGFAAGEPYQQQAPRTATGFHL